MKFQVMLFLALAIAYVAASPIADSLSGSAAVNADGLPCDHDASPEDGEEATSTTTGPGVRVKRHDGHFKMGDCNCQHGGERGGHCHCAWHQKMPGVYCREGSNHWICFPF